MLCFNFLLKDSKRWIQFFFERFNFKTQKLFNEKRFRLFYFRLDGEIFRKTRFILILPNLPYTCFPFLLPSLDCFSNDRLLA